MDGADAFAWLLDYGFVPPEAVTVDEDAYAEALRVLRLL